MTMPKQKRGTSKQDYATPSDLIRAVTNKFGVLHLDLAATKENTKCLNFITPEEDSLAVDWVEYEGLNLWLNPPFANITPWAAKCADFAQRTRKGRIFFLTPASVGSNWFRNHVYKKSAVIFLNDRITFEGAKDPYPKDCMISIFGRGLNSFSIWAWKTGASW